MGSDQLRIDKAEVELGIVRNQRIAPDKGEKLIGYFRKRCIPRKKFRRKTMDAECVLWHLPLRSQITLPLSPSPYMMHQLDAGDFDDTMSIGRIKPRRLCIEDNFPH